MFISLALLLPLVTSLQVLAVSNTLTNIILPLGTAPAKKTTNTYGTTRISYAPAAMWIWSGPGNNKGCSQNITIEISFNVTCLVQSMTFSVITDNHANYTFLGQFGKSDSYKNIANTTASPASQTCSTAWSIQI